MLLWRGRIRGLKVLRDLLLLLCGHAVLHLLGHLRLRHRVLLILLILLRRRSLIRNLRRGLRRLRVHTGDYFASSLPFNLSPGLCNLARAKIRALNYATRACPRPLVATLQTVESSQLVLEDYPMVWLLMIESPDVHQTVLRL